MGFLDWMKRARNRPTADPEMNSWSTGKQTPEEVRAEICHDGKLAKLRDATGREPAHTDIPFEPPAKAKPMRPKRVKVRGRDIPF